MTFTLRAWPRHLLEKDGGKPFIVYYVYGDFKEMPTMRVDKYNSSGVPKGLELSLYNRRQHSAVLDSFLSGYFGQFLQQKPDIDGPVRAARQCIVLKGNPADASSLDYFRDCVGVLMYLLDCGGEAVLDPQTLTWWRPAEWKEIFDSHEIMPAKHVSIVGSPEENGTGLWLHTRGLRKFGRPDLSVKNVSDAQRPMVLQLIEQLINHQALGGVIEEGEQIAFDAAPGIWKCTHHGDEQDPDFNNSHVLIESIAEQQPQS